VDGVNLVELGTVPIPALVHDQAVAHLKEAASAEAVRVGPLERGPATFDDKVDWRARERATRERVAMAYSAAIPTTKVSRYATAFL
jgi:hypothetical protein